MDMRFCKICNSQVIEDEMHFLLDCTCYRDLRNAMYANLSSVCDNFAQLDRDKFKYIMTLGDGSRVTCNVILGYINAAFDKRTCITGHQ